MIDFLQSYVVHLLENMVQPKPPRPKPVMVTIGVSLADVYHERVKKVVVRTMGAGPVSLYIQLDREEFNDGCMECVYEGKGDIKDGVVGDVVIVAKLEPALQFELHPTRQHDIVYRLHAPLHDYLYGFDHSFVHLSGETIHVRMTPLVSDEIVINNHGFKNNSCRGDLWLVVTPSFVGLTTPPPRGDFEAWLRPKGT